MNSNAIKWLLALVVGFGCGCIIAASHGNSHVVDYVRDGLITMAPTLAGLKTRLEVELGVKRDSITAGQWGG